MTDQVSTVQYPAGPRTITVSIPPPSGDPTAVQMVSTGVAAGIVGVDPRTIERWIDAGRMRGGRPRDPDTGVPLIGSHRWADVRHAVGIAAASGRTHLIPEEWRHLVPDEAAAEPAGT